MQIQSLLAFEPAHVEAMAYAFEAICLTLKLPKGDSTRNLVAEKIVEYAQLGERDADNLYRLVLSAPPR